METPHISDLRREFQTFQQLIEDPNMPIPDTVPAAWREEITQIRGMSEVDRENTVNEMRLDLESRIGEIMQEELERLRIVFDRGQQSVRRSRQTIALVSNRLNELREQEERPRVVLFAGVAGVLAAIVILGLGRFFRSIYPT